jgi:hypothetical protein
METRLFFLSIAENRDESSPERHGYVAALNYGRNNRPDALCVVDLDPRSRTYSQIVNTLELPYTGDELHHFGWNACSSALCPYAPHPHLERRYLIVPGMRSSRIYIIDTKPDAIRPQIVKVIEPEEVMANSGYSRPHTVTVARMQSTLALLVPPTATAAQAASFYSTILTLKSLVPGNYTGVHRIWPMISGGTLRTMC